MNEPASSSSPPDSAARTRDSLQPVVRILVLYVVVGVAWIFLSDTLLFRELPSAQEHVRFQKLKGFTFISVTAVLLFFLLRREFHRRQELSCAAALANERYELAIRGSGVGLWDWDLKTHEMFYSPRFKELLGYSDEEFPARRESFAEKIHPEDDARVWAALRAHWNDRVPYDIEFRLRTKADGYRRFRSRGQALWDATGEPFRMAGSLFDVTERVLAQEALQTSEERFKVLARATNDAVWDWNLKTNAIWWNDGFRDLFGYSSEDTEPTAESWTSRIHPDDRTRVVEGIRHTIKARGQNWMDEYRFLRKDGEWAFVLDRGFVLHDEEGEPCRVIGGMTDVTERRRMEDALRQSEDRLAQAARMARLGHWVTDLRTGQVAWSEALLEMLGLTPNTFGGTPEDVFKRMPADDLERFLAARKEALAGADTLDLEHRVARLDGTFLWLHTRARVERDAGGAPVWLRGTSLDITARRRAEEELRASERRYREIVDLAQEGIWIIDVTGRTRFANRRMAEILGCTVEEMRSSSMFDFMDDTARKEAERNLARRNEGVSEQHDFRFTRKDGADVWTIISTNPISDEGGQIIGALGMATDITQRRQAEEELTRIKLAVEFASDAIAIFDSEGRSVYHNRAFLTLLDYTPEQLNALGQVSAIFADPALARQGGAEVLANGSWSGEAVVNARSGRSVELFVRANAVQDAQGRTVAFIGVCTDLGATKRAERTIAEQATLLDQARDAILVQDLEGRILSWNKSAERVFGWSAAEASDQRVQDLLCDNPFLYDQAVASLLEKGDLVSEFVMRTRSGREVLIEGRWTLVRDEYGHPTSILAIDTDITEKKQLEAQFFRAQRLESIGTLAGGIAHDLNNVLGPIIMAVDLFKLRMTDPKDLDLLDTLETSARRGADMVKQVLSFARGIESQRTLVAPAHLLSEIQKIVGDTFPKSITLCVAAEPGVWQILADVTQLHQVLLNLCVNSRDAMPGGGRLTLSAANAQIDTHFAVMHSDAQPGPYVVLSVADTGEGMSPEVLEKVFEPFFTTKEVGKGTGLGLSTALSIVRSHRGFITVESAAGKGTTFKVHLPADAEGDEVAIGTTTGELPRGANQQILVIDDETSVRSITAQTLEAFGYRVVTASNGADGVAIYTQRAAEISAVITDMMMPEMDGATAIRALRRLNPQVKIIAVSGLSAKAAEADAAGAGVKFFLPKPYTAATLLRTLRDLLTA